MELSEEDIIKQSKELVSELESLNRCYFNKDRLKVIKQKADNIIVLLDSKPLEQIKNKK
jgi:hypothetical protein